MGGIKKKGDYKMKIKLKKKVKLDNKVYTLFTRAGENFECSNTCKP